MNILKFVGKGPHMTLAARQTSTQAKRSFSHVISNRAPESQVSSPFRLILGLGPRKNRKLYSH